MQLPFIRQSTNRNNSDANHPPGRQFNLMSHSFDDGQLAVINYQGNKTVFFPPVLGKHNKTELYQ